MKIILILLIVLFGLHGMAQNEYIYFAKNGMLVTNEKDAEIKYEKHSLSKKKIELLEYEKTGQKWVKGVNKIIVTAKKNNQYLIETYSFGYLGIKNKLAVIDTTESGFIIEEYDGRGVCMTEAEVLSVFPKVYHGICKQYSGRKKKDPDISYYYNNLVYKSVHQPKIEGVLLPENEVGQVPQYPGGGDQFLNDLSGKIIFPDNVTSGDLQELFLLLSFTIDEQGELANAHLLNAGRPATDRAILNACEQVGTPWRPAVSTQKKCDFTYVIPLDFSIEVPEEPDPDKIYMMAEKMPAYPGGEEKLRRDIASRLEYPSEAQIKGIQGKVYVSFFVDAKGEMQNIKVVKRVDPLLDAEALRVVKTLGKWIPGERGGMKVCVSYTVPINFAIR